MRTYTQAEAEGIARSAAMRGFSRGNDWRCAHPDRTIPFLLEDIMTCEETIVAEFQREGVLATVAPPELTDAEVIREVEGRS